MRRNKYSIINKFKWFLFLLLFGNLLHSQTPFQEDSTAAMDAFHKMQVKYYTDYGLDQESIKLARLHFSRIPLEMKDSILITAEAEMYFGKGFSNLVNNIMDSAQHYFHKSLDLTFSRFGENHLIVTKCYNKLGNIAKNKSDFREYARLTLKSLRIREQILGEHDVYMMLGNYNAFVFYTATGDYENAFIYKKKYYDIAKYFYDNYIKYLNNEPLDPQLWNNMHTAHIPFEIQIRNLYDFTDTYVVACSRLYSHHDLRSEKEHMLYYLDEMKKACIQIPEYEYFQFIYLMDKYDYELDYQLLDSAKTTFNKLKKILWEVNDKDLFVESAIGMAYNFATIDPNFCLELIHETSSLFKFDDLEIGTKFYFLSMYATAYFHLNELDSALHYVNKCWDFIDQKIGSFQNNKNYFQDLANLRLTNFHDFLHMEASLYQQLHKDSNDVSWLWEAFECFQNYDRVLNELFLLFRKESSFYHSTKKSHLVYEKAISNSLKLYHLTKDKVHLDNIFYWSNQSKSISTRYGTKSRTHYAFDQAKQEELGDLYLLELEIKRLLFLEKQKEVLDSAAIRKLEDNLYQTHRELEIRDDPMLSLLQGENQFDLKSLESSIRNNQEDYLEYFLGENHSFCLGIFKDTTLVVELDHADCINLANNLIKDLRKEPTDFRNMSSMDSILHKLYQKLIHPLSNYLNNEQLIVIPDGVLTYLPFHTLIYKMEPTDIFKRSRNYLLNEKVIRVEYSSNNVLRENQINEKAFDNQYFGIAPEYVNLVLSSNNLDSVVITKDFFRESSDGFLPLLFNQEEVMETNQMLNGMVIIESQATETLFKKNGHSNQILHFAGHSLVNNDHPQYSQLALLPSENEDGSLYAYEIEHLNLNSELVVLSACNTGYGNIIKGEGIMSMARSFKLSGCPNIVMSLWLANDLSTKTIITDFFRNIKDGQGKSTALRNAQLDYLANVENEKYAHPYYWANLMMIGDNERMEFGPTFNYWNYWIVGLLFILILSLIIFKLYFDPK